MKRVIIVRTQLYCGGTLVLDLLCKLLREHGIDARLYFIEEPIGKDTNIFAVKWNSTKDSLHYFFYKLFKKYFDRSKSWRTTFYKNRFRATMPGLKRQLWPFFFKHNTIVIYPDVCYGNFLNAKNVVRWFLFHNRFIGDDKAYGKNDLFITYRDVFNDFSLNPDNIKVTLSYFNSNLYHQYNFGKREEKCYLIRKGRNRKDLPKSFDGPIIDYGLSEEQIVKILNEHKYCYLYDTQTFYANIAAVCGCIPIIVCEPGKTKSDYLSEEECRNLRGKAYADTPEEIQFAVSTRQQLIDSLNYDQKNETNILKFIHYIDEKFKI